MSENRMGKSETEGSRMKKSGIEESRDRRKQGDGKGMRHRRMRERNGGRELLQKKVAREGVGNGKRWDERKSCVAQ